MLLLLLVQIDLSEADIGQFEAYEAAVQPLMARYGGRIDLCLRAVDDRSETHLVRFPDAAAAAAYRTDPDRVAFQPLWQGCGARSTVSEVRQID
jgi:uncharacterized protein (DUF1330 family)